MTPFDFINSINFDKQDLFTDPQAQKDYVPFIVNRGLSYFPDTVLYANEMNIHNTAEKRWQFDFLKGSISKRKRFSKWHKKETITSDLAAVKEYYKYSTAKALECLSILSKSDLTKIKQQMDKGGKV